MNIPTRIFLVLLQLAIGWHFLYEGFYKFQEPIWSSRGYVRNSQGPASLYLRYTAGDPDVKPVSGSLAVKDPTEDLIARFTIKPLDPNEKPELRRWHKHLPPVIEQEWDAYFAEYVKTYNLDKAESFANETVGVLAASTDGPLIGNLPWAALSATTLRESANPLQPGMQRILAERNFIVAKAETAKWLHEGTKKIKRPNFKGPNADVEVSTPQRVQEFLDKRKEAQDLETTQMALFGTKVNDKVKKAKAEEAYLRNDLMFDLNDQTEQMKKSLRETLTYEQKRMTAPAEAKVDTTREWGLLPKIDNVVKYGLLIVGACLILGLFTRVACVGGVGLLLMFYIAMPPLPGLPEPAMSEGHYFIINKNIIEMLALLTIALAGTGRYYGLDAWLDALKPWKWRSGDETEERRPHMRPPHSTAMEAPTGNGGKFIPRK